VPSGAEVREKVTELGEPSDAPHGADRPGEVTVSGEGFARIVERDGIDVAALLTGDPADTPDGFDGPGGDLADELGGHSADVDAAALYQQLTTPVDGGRLLSSTLLSVLITDDGRVLAGAVPGDALLDAAGLG